MTRLIATEHCVFAIKFESSMSVRTRFSNVTTVANLYTSTVVHGSACVRVFSFSMPASRFSDIGLPNSHESASCLRDRFKTPESVPGFSRNTRNVRIVSRTGRVHVYIGVGHGEIPVAQYPRLIHRVPVVTTTTRVRRPVSTAYVSSYTLLYA